MIRPLAILLLLAPLVPAQADDDAPARIRVTGQASAAAGDEVIAVKVKISARAKLPREALATFAKRRTALEEELAQSGFAGARIVRRGFYLSYRDGQSMNGVIVLDPTGETKPTFLFEAREILEVSVPRGEARAEDRVAEVVDFLRGAGAEFDERTEGAEDVAGIPRGNGRIIFTSSRVGAQNPDDESNFRAEVVVRAADPSASASRLIDEAARDARRRALTLARAAGVTLGPPLSLDVRTRPDPVAAAAAGRPDEAAVVVTFAIE
ncbi:MAG: SIMPL domain-containing protein [Planctomycetota bacterium]